MGALTRQNKLINDFLESITKNAADCDAVIFSGDLVQSGDSASTFMKAKDNFIQPILDRVKLPSSRFFICPGNHDINRNEVSSSLLKYLDEEISDNKQLNAFFKSKQTDLDLSYRPLKNYHDFIDTFFKDSSDDDISNQLYSTHIREINGKNVGFVTINTAWRAVGQNDDNNLLFPLDKLNEAIDQVNSCDIKILIHHHPLSDFRTFNKYDLEDLIHKRFDFIFSGHVHKNALSIDFTYTEGAVKIGSSACLTYDNNTDVGYSIITVDHEDLRGTFQSHLYNINQETFYALDQKEYSIPTTKEKIQQNNLRKNIRQRLIDELDNTKELFVEIENDNSDKTIMELSTEPVLKEKSQSEIVKDEAPIEADFAWDTFQKFEDDYIIFGKDKCGKTILLKKLEIELLSDYSQHNFIPFYIDIKEWKNTNRVFDFKKEFSKYYFINQTDAQKLLDEKQIVFLIDNYHIDNENLKKYIEDFITVHANVKLIICSNDTTLNSFEKINIDGRTLKKLHFHRLRKQHIKLLAQRNSDLSEEKQDEIVDKIDNIFKKLSIPFNYWTVSVFLWIFKKDLNANFQNDVDLINLYIERLVEKENLTLSKSSFSFANYKKLLAYLAHYLLTNHHQNSYYAKYSNIISFIESYLSKNPRFRVTSKEIFEYLEEKGIFKKKDDDQYSFRLNGVFEYFIAQYMTIDRKFLNDVIDDDSFYLSFSNEFELYAGFKREDQEFLQRIYDRTKECFSELNNSFDVTSYDNLLISKVLEAKEFSELIEKFTKRLKDGLTESELDKIEEELIKELGFDDSNSDVKCKKVNELNNSSEALEGSLQILGRVYKNVDDIDDVQLVYEIFDYIIDNAIQWGFKIIDDFKDLSILGFTKENGEADAKFLSRVITNYIPTLVQVRLNEMIGHTNLEKIINERLSELRKDSKNNQYKIFLLSFLLLDINLDANKHLLSDVIPLIRIPLIKYSFILKMNYYLGFKANKNAELKRFLQRNIQNQHLKFNSDTDLGGLHRNFSDKQNKQGLIKS